MRMDLFFMPCVEWNRIDRPANCDVKAFPCDIVAKVGKTYFLCQRKNDYNNVVCFRHHSEKAFDKSIVLEMVFFVYFLAKKKGLECIRVQGVRKRYTFVDRISSKVQKKEEDGDLIRFCLLDCGAVESMADFLKKNGVELCS